MPSLSEFKSIRSSYNNLYNQLVSLQSDNDTLEQKNIPEYDTLMQELNIYNNKVTIDNNLNNEISSLINQDTGLKQTGETIKNNITKTNNTIKNLNDEIQTMNFGLDQINAADAMKNNKINNELQPRLLDLDTKLENTQNLINGDLRNYNGLIKIQNQLLENKIKKSNHEFSKDEKKNYYKTEHINIYTTIDAFLFVIYYIMFLVLCYLIFTMPNENMDYLNKFAILFFCFFLPFLKIIVFTILFSELFSLDILKTAIYDYISYIGRQIYIFINNYISTLNN